MSPYYRALVAANRKLVEFMLLRPTRINELVAKFDAGRQTIVHQVKMLVKRGFVVEHSRVPINKTTVAILYTTTDECMARFEEYAKDPTAYVYIDDREEPPKSKRAPTVLPPATRDYLQVAFFGNKNEKD